MTLPIPDRKASHLRLRAHRFRSLQDRPEDGDRLCRLLEGLLERIDFSGGCLRILSGVCQCRLSLEADSFYIRSQLLDGCLRLLLVLPALYRMAYRDEPIFNSRC